MDILKADWESDYDSRSLAPEIHRPHRDQARNERILVGLVKLDEEQLEDICRFGGCKTHATFGKFVSPPPDP
jgi:hypothetical protein